MKYVSIILAIACLLFMYGLNISIEKINALEGKVKDLQRQLDDANERIRKLETALNESEHHAKALEDKLQYYTQPRRVKLWYYCSIPSYDMYWFTREYAKLLSNYIMPDNIVVRQFAKKVVLHKIEDGKFRLDYLNGSPVIFYFDTDENLFGKKEYPVNPDYYLTHGLEGDCEDVAVAVVSILQAKGYNAKLVLGKVDWVTPLPGYHCVWHAWVEADIDGVKYIGDWQYYSEDKAVYVFTIAEEVNGYHPIAEVS